MRDTFFLWWNKHWHRSEEQSTSQNSMLIQGSGCMMELDPETAKLTTFIMPVGMFCFNWLPFGLT